MSIYRLEYSADCLDDDNTPLRELSFDDLLDPTEDKSPQHMDIDVLDSEDEDGDNLADGSLQTPQFKKSVVHIMEDKRLSTSGLTTVLKSHAIKVVTSGAGLGALGGTITSTTPVKPQITEVKILNKLKPVTNSSSTGKIGNNLLTGGVTKTLNNLTQIKTPDGRILYVQKSTSGAAPTAAKGAAVAGSATEGIRRVVAPSNIQKAVLSKGVTLAGAGLVKAAMPGKAGVTGSMPITIKGITPLVGAGGKTAAAPVTSPTATATAAQPSKIHVVRTADGKIIKINQASSSVLLNAKQKVGTPAGTSPATTVTISPSKGNVVLGKSVAQVAPKTGGPAATPVVKQVTATKGSVSSATTSTGSPGQMLVQSGGKQILVSTKNIIKLSPKPGATGAISNTGSASVSTTGLHTVQLSGKGGVQYVRVLTSNKGAVGTGVTSTSGATTTSGTPSSAAGTTAAVTVPRAMPGQKITVVRSPGGVFTASSASTSTAASAASAAATTPSKQLVSSNSNKIVMRAMGSIVPLPSMQTLVSKRAVGASSNASKPTSGANQQQESARKHRLADLNMQLKHLAAGSSDASDSSDAGPEAKKPRFVITMQQGSQQPRLAAATASGSSNSTSPKKVYNFVKATGTNGVKYMICNSGVPQASTSSMRRGYTGYVDSKLRRPLSIASQQARLKQMTPQQQAKHLQLQAQAKQRIRQQQLQSGQGKGTLPTLPTQPPQGTKAASSGKPLFDILKPPSTGAGGAGSAAASADALAGMTSRRKHCNCSKSQCLKLYCDCFANGEFCQDCTCKDCCNNLDYEVERERAIRSCLDRNPSAFKPKITAPNSGDMRLHNKGCNCKRSGCLKNYCECYEAKIPCTSICKCVGCRNMEDRPDVDMDSLDGLLGAKNAPKVADGSDNQTSRNRSNMYLKDDVIEATIMCMMSRVVMLEKQGMPIEDTEREVMEELGESLTQIIKIGMENNDTLAQLEESIA